MLENLTSVDVKKDENSARVNLKLIWC